MAAKKERTPADVLRGILGVWDYTETRWAKGSWAKDAYGKELYGDDDGNTPVPNSHKATAWCVQGAAARATRQTVHNMEHDPPVITALSLWSAELAEILAERGQEIDTGPIGREMALNDCELTDFSDVLLATKR